jgi:hypothetical protein
VRDWHTLDVEAIVDQLGTDRVNGLSASEVSRRLALYQDPTTRIWSVDRSANHLRYNSTANTGSL